MLHSPAGRLACVFKNVHFVLIETFRTAELKPSFPRPSKSRYSFVSYVLTPVTYLQHSNKEEKNISNLLW